MTNIAIDGLSPRSNLNFAGGLPALILGLRERYRCWRRYRTVVAELRQYSDGQLTELGITRFDIERIARGLQAPPANS